MNKLINFLFWLAFWYNQLYIYKIYASQDVYLYSINQSESSENMLIPDKTPNLDELELWHTSNQSYGDLVMSEIASEKENVPIWKSIDEHLKDIDLFVDAVNDVFRDLGYWSCPEVNSGTNGVLMFYNGTSNADKRQLMYSWDTQYNRTVPIPKFVYRMIRTHCSYTHQVRNEEDHSQGHSAIIIIHNDPTTGSDGDLSYEEMFYKKNILRHDRFDCKSCSGWDAIENTYTEAGLTYVCHLTEEMSKILGIDYDPETEPLDLDSMDYTESENWAWTSLTCPRYAGDQSQKIYAQYMRLKGSD